MKAMDSIATIPSLENEGMRWEASAWSASVVVPVVHTLLPWVNSVVDVGCGTAAWLHEFQLCGVERVLGIDRQKLPPHILEINPADFRQANLAEPMKFDGQRFDLAVSLEVAGNLPQEMAEDFITSLCRLSDVVLFSSPIPGQTKDGYVYERWPSYWSALFGQRGYLCFDSLRDRFWYDQRVEWYYAQNMLIFVRASRQEVIEVLRAQRTEHPVLDLVHPRCFEIFRNALSRMVSAALGERSTLVQSIAAGLPAEILAVRAIRAEEQCAALETELHAIKQSTIWKTTAHVRHWGTQHPFCRLMLRRSAKLAWWTLTGQLPRRIVEWRRYRTGYVAKKTAIRF